MKEVAVTKHQNSNSGSQPMYSEQMFELRLENERLKVQLDAMHEKMELVRKMAELRAYVATLETRLSMQNKHVTPRSAHSVTPASHPRAVRNYANAAPRKNSPVQLNRLAILPDDKIDLHKLNPRPAHNLFAAESPVKMPARVKVVLPSTTKFVHPNGAPVSTPKNGKQPKIQSTSRKKFSVPDGGTLIIGGIKIAPLPAKVKSRPKQYTCPVQRKKEVASLEHQIAILTAKLHQLKPQQKKDGKPAADLGVPLQRKNR